MTVKLLTKQHLEFLSLKGGCTGLSESTLVKMAHCWQSHVTAHMYNVTKDYPKFIISNQKEETISIQRVYSIQPFLFFDKMHQEFRRENSHLIVNLHKLICISEIIQ